MAKEFMWNIRQALAEQDVDSWNDHVDDLLHFTKSENAVQESLVSHDPTTRSGKFYNFLVGEPTETTVRHAQIHDVAESAAIYKIERSFERGKDKTLKNPMKQSNWFAKSKNWIEPDDEFLNAVYVQLKEYNKKDHTPTSLNYNNVIWNFQEEYKPKEEVDTKVESENENNLTGDLEEDLD